MGSSLSAPPENKVPGFICRLRPSLREPEQRPKIQNRLKGTLASRFGRSEDEVISARVFCVKKSLGFKIPFLRREPPHVGSLGSYHEVVLLRFPSKGKGAVRFLAIDVRPDEKINTGMNAIRLFTSS